MIWLCSDVVVLSINIYDSITTIEIQWDNGVAYCQVFMLPCSISSSYDSYGGDLSQGSIFSAMFLPSVKCYNVCFPGSTCSNQRSTSSNKRSNILHMSTKKLADQINSIYTAIVLVRHICLLLLKYRTHASQLANSQLTIC